MGIEQIRLMKQMAEYPKPKKVYSIPKKSAKKIRQEIESKDSDKSLEKWYEERRKEMSGFCQHCAGISCMKDDKYYKASIAHLLPKSYFPSVETHPLNWIELCFWKNNCHENMDRKMLDLIDMNCFAEIIDKFVKIYPSIEKSERRRIPSVLMQYVEVET